MVKVTPRSLMGWGRTAPTLARVTSVSSVASVRGILRDPPARGVIARGLGRAYGDAAQNAGGTVLDMTSLGRVHDLDLRNGRMTVDAGASLGDLIAVLVPLGWFLPVVPGTRHVTVGGAIASDIHGKNHHLEGSFCDHVESFELVTPKGDQVTVTPETPAGIFAATAGGMGLTGVIASATLRLLAIETPHMMVDTERAGDLEQVMARMTSGDADHRYSVAWIDCLARGRQLGRSVLIRGDHAAARDVPDLRPRPAAPLTPVARLAAPRWMPNGLLRHSTVAAFNEAYFRHSPARELGRLRPLHGFFFPLDAVRDWNRMYGRRGFLQYQMVLPFGAEASLRMILERLSGAGAAACLAVLKRLGPGRGLLSFPTSGWTLALDLPATGDLVGLLDDLDLLVANAGGRVYLSKDSRLRPELLSSMYPDLESWESVRQGLDPNRVMRSDLSRRLGLGTTAATQS